jgi:hypothetical protein
MSKKDPKRHQLQLAAVCSRFAVQRADGGHLTSFEGVKVITAGEAKGHGITVDASSLQTLLDAAEGRRVKSYQTHGYGPYEDRMGQELGYFENFRLSEDGNSVLADFSFFNSYRDAHPTEYAHLVEMAEKVPDSFGASIAALTLSTWVLADGSEVPADGRDRPESAVDAMPALRVAELLSVDFVDTPAANPGLFRGHDKQEPKNKMDQEKEVLKLQKKVAELEKANADLVSVNEAFEAEIEAQKGEIEELKAGIGPMAANRLAAGAEHPTIDGQKIALESLKANDSEAEFNTRLLKAYQAQDKAGGTPPDENTQLSIDESREPASADEFALTLKALDAASKGVERRIYFNKWRNKFRA